MATLEELGQALIKQALIDAEDRGLVFMGTFGVYNVPCTYWEVDDYIVTYLTDDETFIAEMLTEDMMDELIIEER